ncbi:MULTISPECIES: DUF58 domain-containing protein [unclassified Vibrio]|uniref:DUF58 domain-containing protein n=1 Tax=unclassified Vibrio TaxID=2614977 RepID=UPI001361E24E|nr:MULTISPECIES: DUF58 domain-containing protein [unclassified Vibrio]NAW56447.1 DUF58 domain-containing protein [Vibrio sp. V36_P2S2PM302]NAX27882.1 DUF58 domain-containing protein [Vibrio sp. V38_P2S17PM301]NAX32226.1 DUF58 domain-containing protein [Vibrio sp. V37_P2S8PM304]
MKQPQTPTCPPNADGVTLSLDELLYYKQQTVHWLPPAKSLWSQMLGQHQSRQLGRGMDFAEVRQYQPGDDIRSIDWRVTARTGKTHTKLFSEEREKPVVLYIDLSSSMIFGSTLMLKSVLAAHMASLISWLSVAQKDRIGAVIDTGTQLVELKPTSRNKGPLVLIQQLITLHNQLLQHPASERVDSMTNAFQALNRLCSKGSEVIMISDFVRMSQQHHILLTQLRQHNRVRFVHISDPLEQGKTRYRGVEHVSDKKNTQWLDFASRKTRQRIERAFDSKQQQLKSSAQSLGITFTSLSSDQSLLQQLSG